MFSLFSRAKPPVIVPRIKDLRFLDAVDAIPGMTEQSRPITEPLVGDLLVSYAVDRGESYEAVSAATLSDLEIERADLRSLAMPALHKAMESRRIQSDGTIYELSADDTMGACSILHIDLWKSIERELGGPIVAIIPHREIVVFTRSDSVEGVSALKAVIGRLDFNDNHSLSKHMFRFTTDKWEAVDS